MSTSPARDQPEAELLKPAPSLVVWRNSRDKNRYRSWCEETYGLVEFGPEVFHPADILDALSADAARRGKDEVSASVRAELEQTVCERFPAPIAVPFHAFLEGPREPLSRLYRLRDAWEGLIRLLAALVLSECASIGTAVNGLAIRESERDSPRACRAKDMRTERLATRIGLIEGVIEQCRYLGITLELHSIIPEGVIAEVRRLNAIRNGFSHEGVKSEHQARQLIEEAYPLLREVLLDLSGLEGVELLRLRKFKAGSPPVAEVDCLFGHAQSPRVREIQIQPAMTGVLLGAARVGDLDRVLAKIGARVFDLSPFYYALDDDTGHRTRIAFFKARKNGRWKMEVVGDSVSIDQDSSLHDALMDRFYALVGEGGDES